MAPQPAPTAKDLQRWRDEYGVARPLYETFAVRLVDLLADLLGQEGIDPAHIEGRAKTIDSYVEKIRRKGSYERPLTEITDLCGLRIVTYTLEDLDQVGVVIRAQFAVDDARSVVKPEVPDPDRFGYKSTHYVAKLSPPRSQLAEWVAFDGKHVEIQVRTLLQHTWAAIDHKLNYKTTTEVPQELQRRLFRLSALLEVADEQFDELGRETQTLNAEYGEQIQQGNLDSLAVDAASVDVYIRAYKLADRWISRVRAAGVDVITDDKSMLDRDRRDLLATLKRCEIATIGQFNHVIEDAERWGDMLLQIVADEDRAATGESFSITVDDALTMFVLYGTLASAKAVDSVGWVQPIPGVIKREVASARRPGRRAAGRPPRPHRPATH